ncbi:hypothetical protein DFH08DRAFT_986112 [Mycena albidolilacea]|uniref:U3 small nucleolar RNA-associated protein 10 n=1 Tax=Mycena albidolilacea TaxID=1033008 RepID=A0AAD6Z295_9AGAR|nr:hypothetical protein DFH08DRAFT_986112 [Mycena albidolilacea]
MNRLLDLLHSALIVASLFKYFIDFFCEMWAIGTCVCASTDGLQGRELDSSHHAFPPTGPPPGTNLNHNRSIASSTVVTVLRAQDLHMYEFFAPLLGAYLIVPQQAERTGGQQVPSSYWRSYDFRWFIPPRTYPEQNMTVLRTSTRPWVPQLWSKLTTQVGEDIPLDKFALGEICAPGDAGDHAAGRSGCLIHGMLKEWGVENMPYENGSATEKGCERVSVAPQLPRRNSVYYYVPVSVAYRWRNDGMNGRLTNMRAYTLRARLPLSSAGVLVVMCIGRADLGPCADLGPPVRLDAGHSRLCKAGLRLFGKEYKLTPDAQTWPRSQNENLGIPKDAICLIFASMGQMENKGLDFIGSFYEFVLRQWTGPLFSDGSRDTDCPLLSAEAITQLDLGISGFSSLLDPYVTEAPTGKVLEWLVWINEFNVEPILALFLFYHESPHFAKMLSILHINFLLPFKAAAQNVLRFSLVTEMLKNSDATRFIVKLLPTAITASYSHHTLLAFNSATIHDYLTRTKTLDEGTLLPTLIEPPRQRSDIIKDAIPESNILLSALEWVCQLAPVALRTIIDTMTSAARRVATKQFFNAVVSVCKAQDPLDTLTDGTGRSVSE